MKDKIYDIVLAARTDGVIHGKTKRFAEGDTEDILDVFRKSGIHINKGQTLILDGEPIVAKHNTTLVIIPDEEKDQTK